MTELNLSQCLAVPKKNTLRTSAFEGRNESKGNAVEISRNYNIMKRFSD